MSPAPAPTDAAILWIAGLGVVVLAGLLVGWRRRTTGSRRALANELDDRLAESIPTGTASHLERSPTVRRLAVADVDVEDGSTETFVPVVRVALGTSDRPGTELALEYVAEVIETIHPVFRERDERVDRYDVEFTFGPGGLVVSGECRRVSVPADLADRLLEDERYRAFDLHRDVDRDDGETATLWGRCLEY
ncbi:hypothetical protein [Natrarchaeobius oligotrophus]|uniref:Uncharacterized protein n=1 Tax=Natrarchaeobius chitinivorans TaxID=1679083 RepID=A0A3N6PU77_NATCH|nr:hypothetical protein [Natrarchaeobius chitinivorans]RQH03306.1 hypothetical protein EA472_01620 [Natrarchaeobius chitinivorans]